MNYGSDPADQIVRISLEGTEMVLKLSGLAAKNFALFVYAVLNDQQKVRGKTKLVRMLKERRPFKFFTVPEDRMKEFAKEAKDHGLLYTAIRNKQRPGQIELVVFADDAAKVNRILDNMGLDFVKAQSGEARFEEPGKEQREKEPEKEAPGKEQPPETQTVQTPDGAVDFEVGAAEEAFNFTGEGEAKKEHVPFPVSWTVKMKKKQKETQDILSYHTQAAGCSDKARAKASGGRQPIEECGRTGL